MRGEFVFLYDDGGRGLDWYKLGHVNCKVADWQGRIDDDSPTLGQVAADGNWAVNRVWGGIYHC